MMEMMDKLRKGDLLLIKPKRLYRKLVNIPTKIIACINKGITHVAIYAGKGEIVHCDYKVGVVRESFNDFVKKRMQYCREIDFKIVRPRHLKRLNRVFVNINKYLANRVRYSIKHLFRMLLFIAKGFKIVEPIAFDSFAVCSTFIARVLKEANVDIGRKASIAFMPIDFINKRYFEVKN